MIHAVTLPNGYVVSDDRNRLDMEFVHASLAGVYWAVGRPRALTERSWANCLCFGVYGPDRIQVGFGRLLTDYTFRAHLGDVFIHPASRGLGLGRALVEAILEHPELATVTHWTLTTADAHGLYARYGFRLGEADGKWMALDRTPGGDPA
jgi:GNAT superfamily N-acetyltransferase